MEGELRKLLGELRDSHVTVSWRAAIALSRLGKTAGTAVPRLIEALKDEDVEVRKLAALILGNLGPDAHPALAGLTLALHDDNECVRRRAVVALGQIGDPAALPALIRAMKDASHSVSKAAALATFEMQARTPRWAA